jgi:malate synthase
MIMQKETAKLLQVFGLCFIALVTASATAKEADSSIQPKMHEGMTVAACFSCHATRKDRPKLIDPGKCCNQNCLRCHEDMDPHHPVGAEVTEKKQVSLPLLTGAKVGCMSCHDAFSARTDTRSWKSQSLFAKWFQGQTTYKTYYLRMNNSDGKLCKACH